MQRLRPSARIAFLSLSLLLTLPTFSEKAEPDPGWLGFGFTYQEKGIGGSDQTYLFVQGVLPNSPALRAGLARGDRITAVDGQPVSRHEEGALVDFFLAVRPGQRVRLQVERAEGRDLLELTAVALPEEFREGWERLVEARRRAKAGAAEDGDRANPPKR